MAETVKAPPLVSTMVSPARTGVAFTTELPGTAAVPVKLMNALAGPALLTITLGKSPDWLNPNVAEALVVDAESGMVS
jgi:hypothetical protein